MSMITESNDVGNVNKIDEEGRNAIVGDVESLRKDVSYVNSEIMKLMEDRRLILHDIENRIFSISSSEYFLGHSVYEIENEWTNKRFNSQVVKKAVSSVRKCFFNDEDEAFRSFNCIRLSFNSGFSGLTCVTGTIDFEFTDGENVFSISIPSLRKKDYDSYCGWGRNDPYYGLSENKWLGKIYVSVRLTSCLNDTFCTSLRISDIREKLNMLIHDFKGIRTQMLEESKNRYEVYKIWGNGFEQQKHIDEDDSLEDMMKYMGFFQE